MAPLCAEDHRVVAVGGVWDSKPAAEREERAERASSGRLFVAVLSRAAVISDDLIGAAMSKEGAGRGLGKALGWCSLVLGLPQVLAPDAMNRFVGVEPTAASNALMRSVGLQELSVGAGTIRSVHPTGWLWSRVGGDLVHLGILGSALASTDSDDDRVRWAMRAVVGVALLDVLAAVRLTRSSDDGQHAVSTVTINRPPPEVYRAWKNYEQLPRFMAHLESVEPAGPERWRWSARAPGGTRLEWDAEVVVDQPDRLIAWRSIHGDVSNAGSVRFAPAPGDRGTEVTVELAYRWPGGRAGTVAAALLGAAPKQAIRDDLRRFKQVLETGEVLRTDGAPDGTMSKRQLIQRSARPRA